MSNRKGQKARAAFQKVADGLAERSADVERLKQWACAVWSKDRDIDAVIAWTRKAVAFLVIDHFKVDDGEDVEWNGWYYSFSGDIDSPWREHFTSSTGPVKDNVVGPFNTEEAARQAILADLREMADSEDWLDDSATTGSRVRLARVRAGLTQVAAAAGAKMSQPQWAMIEAGKTSPTVATIEKVAIALGVKARELV